MHAAPLQTRLHHQLVAAFHRPVANRPARGLEVGVVHLALAFLQIGDMLLQRGMAWRLLHQAVELGQDRRRALVLELMQLVRQPGLALGRLFAPHALPHQRHPLRRVGKVQDAPHPGNGSQGTSGSIPPRRSRRPLARHVPPRAGGSPPRPSMDMGITAEDMQKLFQPDFRLLRREGELIPAGRRRRGTGWRESGNEFPD
jgi:hypothetical protein